MKIDEKAIKHLYHAFANPRCRKIIQVITTNGALGFKEIGDHVGTTRENSNLLSHYLRQLKNSYVLRVDDKTKKYYLTRLGVKVLGMFEEFEKLYVEYDMNDVNQDGFVEQVTLVRMRQS